LRNEGPRYAKLLPELPRLFFDFLQNNAHGAHKETLALLAEQKKTNRLLSAILYGGIGFFLGLVAMQILMRIRLF